VPALEISTEFPLKFEHTYRSATAQRRLKFPRWTRLSHWLDRQSLVPRLLRQGCPSGPQRGGPEFVQDEATSAHSMRCSDRDCRFLGQFIRKITARQLPRRRKCAFGARSRSSRIPRTRSLPTSPMRCRRFSGIDGRDGLQGALESNSNSNQAKAVYTGTVPDQERDRQPRSHQDQPAACFRNMCGRLRDTRDGGGPKKKSSAAGIDSQDSDV